ncbi:metal-binding domain of MaoC dehydratase family protein [Mycobacterium xenopi 3993]|nr:metal-binding domain of MaoC dehydratase family protein [Mycobacterium xenopi 3993]
MSTTETSAKSDADTAAIEGRITDEDIARAKAQIGIPVNQRDEAWNKLPSADAISHFAFGCGDDNPLFHDPEYGAKTRWHGQIAPPTFLISTGLDQTPKFTDPQRKKLFRGLFRGTGKYYAG